MQLLTKGIRRSIANIGEYIESEHVWYWKKFHRFNVNTLNKVSQQTPIEHL